MLNETAARQRQTCSHTLRPTRVRYCVLLLSFLVGVVMFLDRACIGTVTPSLMSEFHLDKITTAWCLSMFNWTYSIFQIPGGWLADRFGSRIVLTGAVAWWSIFTAATGGAFNAASLAITRALFGVGEAAAWPAASRSLLRWLPLDQRAFGQGFQHSGSRLGGALAPAIAVVVLASSGWRAVFYVFGGVGILVALAWYAYYRDLPQQHSGINEAELRLLDGAICAQPATRKAVPWRRILLSRELLCLSVTYSCYGWVFWIYLLWLPTYLSEARHFTRMEMGFGASAPLIAAAVNNIVGGKLSDRLVRKWKDLRRGRVTVSAAGFLLAGIAILPGVLATSAVGGLASFRSQWRAWS
jgi:MFS family permease